MLPLLGSQKSLPIMSVCQSFCVARRNVGLDNGVDVGMGVGVSVGVRVGMSGLVGLIHMLVGCTVSNLHILVLYQHQRMLARPLCCSK